MTTPVQKGKEKALCVENMESQSEIFTQSYKPIFYTEIS